MFYVYILYSARSKNFYYGFTKDLRRRLEEHNQGESKATKSGIPWELVCYSAFSDGDVAKDFENYLKTGSGKAFAYKRFMKIEKYKKTETS
jgi:putative endonuclease